MATTELEEDEALAELGRSLGLTVVRGSQRCSLSLLTGCERYRGDDISTVTGDCPFVDPDILDEMIQEFKENNFDYYSNCISPTYPDGLDIEIFRVNLALGTKGM